MAAVNANGSPPTLADLTKRLRALEEHVDRHSRVIKRAIEIAASYFQSDRA